MHPKVCDAVLSMLTTSLVSSGELIDLIRGGYAEDPWLNAPLVARLQLTESDGLWYKGKQVVVPNVLGLRTKIIAEYHDCVFSGHRGIARTKKAIGRGFWWPGLDADVTKHVQTCPSCQHNKPLKQKPGGLLQPLRIPEEVWDSVSMDLITQLPSGRVRRDCGVRGPAEQNGPFCPHTHNRQC